MESCLISLTGNRIRRFVPPVLGEGFKQKQHQRYSLLKGIKKLPKKPPKITPKIVQSTSKNINPKTLAECFASNFWVPSFLGFFGFPKYENKPLAIA